MLVFTNVFFILLLLGLCAWMLDQFQTLVTMEAPWVKTPNEVLDQIAEKITIKPGDIVYDLGCGDAQVLIQLAKKNPNATFIGVEKLNYVCALAWLKIKKAGLHNVIIKKGDLYKLSIKDATHIYLWIYPQMVNKILPKLERELTQGVTVYSMDFPFHGKDPVAVYDLSGVKNKSYARKLFEYRF
ncbi:hypothetical protein A3K34_04695 [candidate division WWE3 bacterium RIFOXYC1_FULL_40_10]|nr:MAG: hypothetical protein A3K58_04695 [candidate division WWE3 bacterium RIFOXYB1_FULL_40_22]OGC62136.1 MAG: hypothetical protein A3K37_04695 [candidate division WWE3 bacterium RIFOXYA1_FULL_40_11]OGC66519.1 MAG: hypothetical protein A3K34_04695 [candidate division WWE3 bacterium RIFOXYC1_FULL_40_10]OGC67670.1 MAG: hypothetical protein A2450_02600 [candidate division WWE3 bacterium RIFOXYC2_FULL_40_11]OGC70831.1 MAG: hypothetical protein A2602_03345 [candidate division WWE3 bacterium RIFOXYD